MLPSHYWQGSAPIVPTQPPVSQIFTLPINLAADPSNDKDKEMERAYCAEISHS